MAATLAETQESYNAGYAAGHKAACDELGETTIGPIRHSNPMCQKAACTCWCQACERHNWRHEREGKKA